MRLSREPFLALALGLAVALPLAVPAFAQSVAPASGGYPVACEPAKVSKTDVDRAHTVFLSGKGFLDESNYDKAISYFKDAYSIDCSVHAILPIIATAYERKGDKASAVQALQEYLKRVPAAPDREVVERRIKNLQDQMATPVVASAPSASVSASATAAAPSATTSASPPPPPASATAAPSAPPPDNGGGHTVLPWVVVGVGGAALVAGVVLYAVGGSQISDAEKTCGTSHTNCPAGAAGANAISEGNNGRTLETVGVVVGAVGVAGVAGGLLWHFLEPTSASGAPSTAVSPVVAPGYAGVALGGNF
jgi:tetratricopeptide (TPR) repeat protein